MPNLDTDQPVSPADPNPVVKVSFSLRKNDLDILCAQATLYDTTVSDQLYASIGAWRWMLEQWREGNLILVKDSQGHYREIKLRQIPQ